MLKRMFSTLECGIPYMRKIKYTPLKYTSLKTVKLLNTNININYDSDSDSDFFEFGIPYMRDISKCEYKKIFKEHEKRLYNATKSLSSD